MRTPIVASLAVSILAITKRDSSVLAYNVPSASSRLPRRDQNLILSRRNNSPNRDILSSTSLRLSAVDRTINLDELGSYFYGDEERILNVYEEWRNEYSKGDFGEVRYQNFRSNYIKLMTANAAELTVARDMGYPDPIPLSLNEYGDYSPEEFNDLQNNQIMQQLSPANESPTPMNGYSFQETAQTAGGSLDEERERVRQIYKEWCYKYGKSYEESRLEIFATNLQVVENYFRDTGKKAELNQYADVSPEEFEQIAMSQNQNTQTQYNPHLNHVSTNRRTSPSTLYQYYDDNEVERIRQAYMDWCGAFGKQYDESRLDIFASNLLAVENYRAQTGANVNLNANADLSPEEYSTIVSNGMGSPLNEKSSSPGHSSGNEAGDYRSYNESPSLALSSLNGSRSSYIESLTGTAGAMTDEQVRSMYRDWCNYYEKEPYDDGFYYFKNKYTTLEKLYRETGEEFTLDEYADLPEEQYNQESDAQAEQNRLAEEARLNEEEQRRIEAERLVEEARLKEEEQKKVQAEEQRRALEARQKEEAEEKSRKEEAEREELVRRREEERKKAEELLQLEEERKRIEEEVRVQKEKEELAKFEEARKRVEEARLSEQEQATAAAKTTLEQREEAAAQVTAEEDALIYEDPNLLDIAAERERLREERLYLEEALRADKARLNEEKRLEELARMKLEETNSLLEESLKEDDEETSDPIVLPRSSYLGAVAKTWVDRTAYLEALQSGQVGALPTTAKLPQKPVEVPDEMEKQTTAQQSKSLIDSIWNFMKEEKVNGRVTNDGYSKSLIRQADKVLEDANNKSTEVIGEEIKYLKKAVSAMRRRNKDNRAADRAILEAKEWEQIQTGLEKEAKRAKTRREHEERMAKEARQKARSLKSERRQHDKRAEEARKEERSLKEGSTESNPTGKGMFSFFSNPFESGESGTDFESPATKKEENIFSLFGDSKSDADRNMPPSNSMTHPVKAEKKESWLDAVFGFFAGEEETEAIPGLGTITLEPAKKASVFDLFVSPDSIAPVREPGRGSIRIDDSQESSIFSFFAKFGISQKKATEIDPVRMKKVMDYESKVRTRQEKLSRLKAGRSRILEEKDKKMSRKEARRLQRELDSLAAGNFTAPPRASDIPQLARWTRTPDDRITGWISDPAGGQYKMGTKITTSPIKGKIVKPGITVTTVTGSKYRLGLLAEREAVNPTSPNRQNYPNGANQRLSPMGSIFGRLFPEDIVPSLVEWTQNDDGTITGFVNNKEGFEDGTQITTSPVEMGARRGIVIETVGGSKYKLMKQKYKTRDD